MTLLCGCADRRNPCNLLTSVHGGREGFELVDARLADNRLPNVRASYSTFDALDANDASMDLVTWVLGPHDLYYHPESAPAPGDPAKAYSEIFRILKPGGAFVVIDHVAAEGSPETTGHDLHRIDPAIVKLMVERAGFVLEAEGDFLVNPDDSLSVSIEDIQRGHTSQFALRFRRPALTNDSSRANLYGDRKSVV